MADANLEGKAPDLKNHPRFRYPRMVFHPNQPARLVNSKQEWDDLGPEWTDVYSPFNVPSER